MTIDPKKQKDKTITENQEIIKEKYPIVAWLETAFRTFHDILMGDEPGKVDGYINKYEDSLISSFCNGLKWESPGQECDIPECEFWICRRK